MTLLPRPSLASQRRLTGAMQVLLVAIVAYGFLAGEQKAISNGIIAFLVTLIPATLERRYDLPLDPWLALWITMAVFLHTVGSAGFYARVEWWDHMTHALSASLVAAVGYTTLRAVDLHSDGIRIPPRFAFVFIVVVVLAFGVLWELFEFGLDIVATETGIDMPLAQHGLEDTVSDLTYNTIGAILVGLFGQAHLTGVAELVRDRLLGSAPE
ncbi:hypothetical protein DJ71_21405 [Halorubrum sp. E3]|uniref:Membrane-spanning protein n=1 Tax=Halorubrum distributum JCM 13916 TaxID=1230455 RepID=M0PNH1_9EURY|nr:MULTISPECIES: hypothetical protein [Halorubrum distributum group]EMA71536.1 hypothetical protein C462_05645 [Halorubrum arcis JCM 13916]MDV7348550.1 hypothetical protein [Halorubrum distributum]OYR68741.1 hypothetical protein DJ71_21405 [Halorubrum sp. E3]